MSHAETEPQSIHPLFRTYELLEHILLYLDHITLRNARLVDHFWHSVIQENATLCTTWRQRLRLRQLNILLLGAGGVDKRSLIEKWCYISLESRKLYDYGFRTAVVRLPATEGEIWMAQLGILDGESGVEALMNGCTDFRDRNVGAYVLVYDVGSRFSFEEVERWWRAGKLSTTRKTDYGTARAGSTASEDGSRSLEQTGASIRVSSLPSFYSGKAEEDQGSQWPPSPSERSPVLLALIATKCDIPVSESCVETREGETLARKMGVPFYESPAETAGSDSQIHVNEPLQSFWRTYRDERMDEKAERQRQREMGMKGQDEVSRTAEKLEGGREQWWRRWPWQS